VDGVEVVRLGNEESVSDGAARVGPPLAVCFFSLVDPMERGQASVQAAFRSMLERQCQ
jgi:hypothetical protein